MPCLPLSGAPTPTTGTVATFWQPDPLRRRKTLRQLYLCGPDRLSSPSTRCQAGGTRTWGPWEDAGGGRDNKAGLVYSDFYDLKEGEKTLHPLIDYQPGSVRDTFDFGPLILFSMAGLHQAVKKHGMVAGVSVGRALRPSPEGFR